MNDTKMSLAPVVIESTHKGERVYDIWSRLMKDRIIFLGTEVNDHVANTMVAQMLFLASEDPDKDINMYINSPGGSVTAGLAIYDTMQHIACDVVTTVIGQASSMGAVLLSAGAKGKRNALPNSRVMIHQPMGGAWGQASDIEIRAKEMLKHKSNLMKILAHHTGQSIETVTKDCDRDNFMDAVESKAYGLVDNVIKGHK